MLKTFKPRVTRKYIGTYRPRIDGIDKASGRAKYIDDITLKSKFPGLLYAKYLRSPYANAIIKDFDASKAENLPGVKAIISYKDSEVAAFPLNNGSWTDGASNASYEFQFFQLYKDRKILDNHVRCVGDEAGIIVAAESEEIAEEALELIDVEWKVLPHVLTIEDALKPDAPVIHPEINSEGNLFPWDPHAGPFTIVDGKTVATFAGEHDVEFTPYTSVKKGNIKKAFEEADIVVEANTKYSNPVHNSLDPWCCMATWEGDQLVMYSNTYEADQLRIFISSMLKLSINKVRCISSYVGGSFGRGDTGEKAFFILTSILSKRTGRPVKFRHTRKESFVDGRTSAKQWCKIGAMKDGTVKGIHIKQVGDAGAYADISMAAIGLIPQEVADVELYHIPNITIEARCVYTNKITASCMRCIGNIQFNFTLMAGMEKLAEKLKMDLIEILIKNFGCHLPRPDISIEGVLKEGAKRIGWYKKLHKPGEGTIFNKTKKRGIGFSLHDMWHTAPQELRRGPMQVTIWINIDGTVKLEAPTIETGPGSNSCVVFACADALGVSPENISWIETVDTKTSLKDQVQTDSAVSHILSEGVHTCALKAKRKLIERAAKRLKISPDKLDIDNGWIFVKDNSDTGITIKKLMGSGDLIPMVTNVSHELLSEDKGVPFQATFVEVEIDTETGALDVLNFVIVTDMGTVMFPAGAEGQMVGGQCQALGEALTEQMIYDDVTGIPLNLNWIDYKILTAIDFPKIEPVPAEYWKGNGEFGACGIGEGVLTCTPRAIAMAVHNALGISIDELPITPKKIIESLTKRNKNTNKIDRKER